MANEDNRPRNAIVAGGIAAAKAKAEVLTITPAATPATPTKPEMFDAVRQLGARAKELELAAILDAWKATGDRTRVQYKRIIKRRLVDAGGRADLAGLSRASWYPARAALRIGLAETYRVAKRGYDAAMKGGDMDTAARAIQRAKNALDDLEAVSSATAPPAEKIAHSARQRLPKVAGSWQAQVYEQASAVQRPAVAVLWATGCRPAELARGVDVFIDKDSGALCVRIPGAKVNDAKQAGQPVRVLVISKSSRAGKALLAVLGDAQRVQVRRAAKRITKDFLAIRPKLPAGWTVSAYSFRHQAAANLKADLGDAGKTASALGHRSTRSQQRYGTARQRQAGGGAILDAGATHTPKETRGMVVSPPARDEPSGPSLS